MVVIIFLEKDNTACRFDHYKVFFIPLKQFNIKSNDLLSFEAEVLLNFSINQHKTQVFQTVLRFIYSG